MKFSENRLRSVIKGYLDNPGIDFDEDNYKIVENLVYTTNYEEIIFAYGVACGELVKQGLMNRTEI